MKERRETVMSCSNCHQSIKKATNSLQEECIRVQKVYDWVTDALSVTREVRFTSQQLEAIRNAMNDPNRRPLRFVCQTQQVREAFRIEEGVACQNQGTTCDQVGEKQTVTVPVGGKLVEAQLVDLVFKTDVVLKVLDRLGNVVTSIPLNVTAFQSFVLCYPDGTDLFCKVTKVICRIPSGAVLVNNPVSESIRLEVIFCVDIQVEAEVKLEVLAKFCAPRENDIEAPIVTEVCPEPEFPPQCPAIFPRPNCDCQASGNVTGQTPQQATEIGIASVDFDICPNCHIKNSRLLFTFKDEDFSDGAKDFTFQATSFDQSTLKCEKSQGGLRLTVSGTGEFTNGKLANFTLTLWERKGGGGQQFEVTLTRFHAQQNPIFTTGRVNVTSGSFTIEDCVTFEDIKLKKSP